MRAALSGHGGVRVVEFLPGQLRAAEVQVVVRVTDAQVRARHVAQDGPRRGHRQARYSSSVTCSPHSLVFPTTLRHWLAALMTSTRWTRSGP